MSESPENTFRVGGALPYFCSACHAVPRAGYCNLAGCPTSPATLSVETRLGCALSDLPREELIDRLMYAAGMFYCIKDGKSDVVDALAQAGLDFIELGEKGCAEMRGDAQ